MLELEITLVCLFTHLWAQFSLPTPSTTTATSPPLHVSSCSPYSSVSFCLVASSSHQLPLLCVLFSVRARFKVSLLAVFPARCSLVKTLLVYPLGLSWWGSLLCCVALWSLPPVKLVFSNLAVVWLIAYGVQDHYHFLWVDFLFYFPSLSLFALLHCVCVLRFNSQVMNWFIMVFTTVDLTLWELSEFYQLRPIRGNTFWYLASKKRLHRKRRWSRSTCFPATKPMSILHFKALYGRTHVYPDHYCLVLIARL